MVCPFQLENSRFMLPVLGMFFLFLPLSGLSVDEVLILIIASHCSIRPHSTIPICLDLGTNNQKFLDDPLYLGLRRRRVSDPEMNEFMDELMREMKSIFPKLLVQFEVCIYTMSTCAYTLQSLTSHVGLLNRPRLCLSRPFPQLLPRLQR